MGSRSLVSNRTNMFENPEVVWWTLYPPLQDNFRYFDFIRGLFDGYKSGKQGKVEKLSEVGSNHENNIIIWVFIRALGAYMSKSMYVLV